MIEIVSIKDYFKGGDTIVVPNEHVASAGELLDRVNQLLFAFLKDHKDFVPRINSGYRTVAYNATVPGAAPNSNHTTGRAVDIGDNADRTLAKWCLLNYRQLADLRLWCEDPRATPTWVHFQSVPPRSGLRFYMPNAAAAAKFANTPLTTKSIDAAAH